MRLYGVYRATDHDDDFAFYQALIQQALPPPKERGQGPAESMGGQLRGAVPPAPGGAALAVAAAAARPAAAADATAAVPAAAAAGATLRDGALALAQSSQATAGGTISSSSSSGGGAAAGEVARPHSQPQPQPQQELLAAAELPPCVEEQTAANAAPSQPLLPGLARAAVEDGEALEAMLTGAQHAKAWLPVSAAALSRRSRRMSYYCMALFPLPCTVRLGPHASFCTSSQGGGGLEGGVVSASPCGLKTIAMPFYSLPSVCSTIIPFFTLNYKTSMSTEPTGLMGRKTQCSEQ